MPDLHPNPSSTTPSAGESSHSGQPPAPSTTIINAMSTSNEDAWRRKTILAFDGGGVRGISSLLILQKLMEEIATIEHEMEPIALHSVHPLRRRYPTPVPEKRATGMSKRDTQGFAFSQNASSSPYLPCHYFDYIAGTSTGGLIAIMIGRLSMTVDEALEAYSTLSDKVFGHPRHFHIRKPPWIPREKYNATRLESAIKEIVKLRDPEGHDSTLFFQPYEEMCKTIIITMKKLTSTQFEIPYVIRSYLHAKNTTVDLLERNPGQVCRYQVWEVARATTAAPTYFKTIKFEKDDDEFEFIDGGFGVNNPSEEAYRSVTQRHNNNLKSVSALVSIGTGKLQGSTHNPRGGYNMYLHYAKRATKLATGSERTHESVFAMTRGNADYRRFNVEQGLGKLKMDAWKGTKGDKTLELIYTRTRAYLEVEATQSLIKDTARQLVNIRRSRARTDEDRWERFCHAVTYRCTVPGCDEGDTFEQRQYLKQHLERSHSAGFTAKSIEAYLDEGKEYPLFPHTQPGPAPSNGVV